jgi:sugar phosphate isomerase/epimerase
MRAYSLAHLTVLDVPPPRMTQMAAQAGYSHVGFRLWPAVPRGPAYLLSQPAMVRETKAALRDTGVKLFDIEIVWLRPETRLADYARFLEVGASLGARAVLVGGDDPVEARLTARLAALCEMAAPLGLTINLEIMPWTATRDLPAALRVISAIPQTNVGLLVDTLHFHRSRSSVAQLAKVPPHLFNYAQLCDAPDPIPGAVADLQHTARSARLFPGEGDIDLAAIIAALPADLPMSLEIPNAQLAVEVDDLSRITKALTAARSVVESTERQRNAAP